MDGLALRLQRLNVLFSSLKIVTAGGLAIGNFCLSMLNVPIPLTSKGGSHQSIERQRPRGSIRLEKIKRTRRSLVGATTEENELGGVTTADHHLRKE